VIRQRVAGAGWPGQPNSRAPAANAGDPPPWRMCPGRAEPGRRGEGRCAEL
jgi:hypothetical protein